MAFPKEISDFMAKYSVNADEIWTVRPGAYAIKHKALERVAAQQGLELSDLMVETIDLQNKAAVIRATMRKNGKCVMSYGEATPYNSKNAYPVAMAEKRAIDRCILKLLQIHGALYSESEADEFTDPGDGEKGRINRSTTLARDLMKKAQTALRNAASGEQLDEWRVAYKEHFRALPNDFFQQLEAEYNERVDEIRTACGPSNGG